MNGRRLSRREVLAGAAVVLGSGALAACRGHAGATSPPSTGRSDPGSGSPSSAAPDTALAATAAGTDPSGGPTASTTGSVPPDSVASPGDATAAPTSAASQANPAPGGPARYVSHGPAAGDRVALTFHFGGDPALVTALLDLMDAKSLPATFFAIGDWITAHPALGHRAVEAGHELGNHTKSHLDMLTLGRARVREEIVGGGQALVPFIGSIGRWFRPSGTDVPSALILEEAGKAGYAVSVGYDLNSYDYKEPGAQKVIATVNSAVHPGAVVSLHFGHQDTIDALPAILDHLARNRLVPVTVGTLLG